MASKKAPITNNQNLLAAVIYILFILNLVGLIVAILFLIFERKNSFIRFHALHAICVYVVFVIINIIFAFIPGLNRLLMILSLAEIVVWIFLTVKAYQGTRYKLPYIGDLAESLLKKIG